MKEFAQLGWNPKTISSIGTLFFGFAGCYGLYSQSKNIWRNKSALSVSVPWTIIFTFMFGAYFILGLEKQSFIMVAQGILRVGFYIPIILGVLKYKGLSCNEKKATAALTVLITLMIGLHALRAPIFLILSILGIAGVGWQGKEILKNKTAGRVSLSLLIIYTLSIIFWIWYAYQFQNTVLLRTSLGFLVAYIFTLVAWLKYPPTSTLH